MVENQSAPGLKRGLSVIKFSVAEDCKLWEIYIRKYDVHGEACFSKKSLQMD